MVITLVLFYVDHFHNYFSSTFNYNSRFIYFTLQCRRSAHSGHDSTHVNMSEMGGYGQGQPQEQGLAQQQAGTFVPGATAFVPQTGAGYGGPPADGTVGGQIQAGWFDELVTA